MTEMGRRSGIGDMLTSVYDPNEDGVIAVAQTEADMEKGDYDSVINALVALAADHNAQHENGGADEIDATGLTGTGGLGLMVDGVAGRVLRQMFFYISNGTNADTIKCQGFGIWNGDVIDEVDNIGKGTPVGVFSLDATGEKLTIDASAFSGAIKLASCQITRGDPTTFPSIYPEKSGNNLRLHFYEAHTATSLDIATHIGAGQIRMLITYITDA